MARIRTIKPEFWSDEKLGPLSPIHRLVFLGLVSQADDGGRLVDSVRLLDGLLFSHRDDSCAESLNTLADLGVIERGTTSSGQQIIEIVGWTKHQRVDKPSNRGVLPPIHRTNGKRRSSRPAAIPPTGESRDTLATPSGETREPLAGDSRYEVDLGSGPGSGPWTVDQDQERERHAREASASPDGWTPNDEHRAFCRSRGLDFELELTAFRAWNEANAGVTSDATFTLWLTRAVGFNGNGAHHDEPPARPAPVPYSPPPEPEPTPEDRARIAADAAARKAALRNDPTPAPRRRLGPAPALVEDDPAEIARAAAEKARQKAAAAAALTGGKP